MRKISTEARGVVAGVLLFLVTMVVAFLLPADCALEAFAALLGFIGAIYVGMAITQGKQVILQFTVALGFMFTGLLGLWVSPWILVLGYLAHGLWDWVHHDHKMQVELTRWYAPFCLVYDWLVALAIAIWWVF